jgi:hypothetical protein
LKGAANTSDYRSIFESRRSAYGQSLVLLNDTSHDEENYTDPWQALVRYAVCNTEDGVPLIFPGQELGVSQTYGYSLYETNFGKQVAQFKKYNSLAPAWADADYGNDQLYPVYSAIGTARKNSAALRSANRYFIDQTGGGGTHASIFSVAKYATKNASPATSDVVFAFANIDRNNNQAGNFNVAQDTDGNSVNDYGIKPARSYNVKNIAAYTGIDGTRRDVWQWNVARTGSDILSAGIYVAMNKVPTVSGTWAVAPYEAQYLKLYDVTAPTATPSQPAGPNPYPYETGTSATFSWNAVAADSEGVVPGYKVNVVTNGGTTSFITTGTTYTVSGTYGSNVSITVQAVNPGDTTSAGPASISSGSIKLLNPAADEDGDGMANATEKAAGTNPLNNASIFAVKSITRSGNTVTVTWSSVAGKNYVLQSRAALTSGTWGDIGGSTTAGTGGDVSYPDTVSSGDPAKYYRVRIAP